MISNKKDVMIKKGCGEHIRAQNLNESGRTEVKHDPQLLLRLRKLLLPGLPCGRVLHEVVLTIVTANEVNSPGRTVSEKQTIEEQR